MDERSFSVVTQQRKDSKIRHRYNGLIPKIPTLAQAPQGPAKSHGVDVECYVITT